MVDGWFGHLTERLIVVGPRFTSGTSQRLTIVQCYPNFLQPPHTFLEPLTRRHTAFMTLILYTRLNV